MATDADWDVLVVGAGMAGLTAARTLAEAGRRVLVLESTDRVGGRIRTVRQGGVAVELGAEFIHGRPPELWALIEEAGLATSERTGTVLEEQDGRLAEATRDPGDDDPLEGLVDFSGPDLPFADYLDRLSLSPRAHAAALAYAEGYNAAVATEASTVALGRQQVAEDGIEGDRQWRLPGGYDRLAEFQRERLELAGGQLLFASAVDAVRWERGQVRVLSGTREWHARRCVVTLPLGVLQAGSVRFTPAPGRVLEAAASMRMGQVFRMSLIFRERLWPDGMSFLIARGRLPQVWWTGGPEGTALLTAWAGGPKAVELLALPEASRVEAVAEGLGAALGLGREAVMDGLLAVHLHDWQQDPNSLGAYSWVPVGGLDASRMMAEPVGNTLFFAGEHTDTSGHWGTVHAALGSGLRAAQQILAAGVDR